MRLSTDSIHRLDQLVSTSMVAGIKKLIIEPGKIRGIDEKQSVIIITTDQVPDLDGKQVGINRIDSLSARLNLVKSQGDLQVEATESQNSPNDISILDLQAGKTKAQFRCASVEAVKGVPRSFSDTLVWEVKVTSKIIPTLTQGVSAMGSETITIASRDGTSVSFECIDDGKDIFTTDATEPPQWIGDGASGSSFCQKYPAKTFISLLKEAVKFTDPVTLRIGEGGILTLKVNGFDFFIIPAP